MDFKVNKGDLLKELQYVQGGVERKTTIPILAHLLLETSGNDLIITATDLDVTVQCKCPAAVKASGTKTVAARKLFDIVRFLPEAEIHFKSGGENWINVTCERSKFKIASLPKENFPDIPEEEAASVMVPPKPLNHMSNRCIFAITQEESRYTLNGALMILAPKSLTFVATDGHRLVFISRAMDLVGVEEEERVLVPKKTLTELAKLSAEYSSDIEFRRSEKHLFFRVGDRLLVSRRLSGQFPNYNMVIPRDNDKQVVLNTAALTAALKRVAVMADEESRAVKLSLKENQLDIESSGTEVGEAKESVSAVFQGDSMEIGFNAQYLLDFLAGLETEEVLMELRDEETQGLLKPQPEGDYQHQYVLMPMKL